MLGFAAVNTGNNLLFLIVSALLAFMSVTGVTGWLNIRSLKVETFFPDEIYAGLPTLIVIELKNIKRYFPSFLLRLSAGEEKVVVPIIGRAGQERFTLLYRFPERGPFSFTKITVCSSFPVNFFVRCCIVAAEEKCLVFPAPRPGAINIVSSGRDRRGQPFEGGSGQDGDIEKIGNYTGMEPFKLIHWRLTAKHDELKVKELGITSQEPVLIDVAEDAGSVMEERLGNAVYHLNRLLRAGHPVGLRIGQKIIPPAATRTHRLSLLSELALYGKI